MAIEWGNERSGNNWETKTKTFASLAGDESTGGAMVHSLRSLGSAALNWYVHFGEYISCLEANLGLVPPFYAHFGAFRPFSVPILGPQDKAIQQVSTPTSQYISLIHMSALNSAILTLEYTQLCCR